MQFNTTLTRQIVLLFTLLFSVTSARNVQFSVVSFGKNVKVKIGNKNYDLKKVNNTPLFKASISVNNNAISYQYIEDNKTEAFSRTLSKDKTTTDNDFYGRKDTVKKLPQFPTLYKWNRSVGKGELFDDSYIPTVYISGTNSQTFFTSKKPKKTTLENVVFILKNNVYTFSNVQSVAKNYAWDKFQFKVSLPNNGIQGRYILKFRDNNEDPTFMRQDLYGDILNAVGCPTIQSVKTRVYVNNQPVGYYILQEEAASNSFIRSAFYGDNNGKYLVTKTKDLGYALDGHTGSDFYYTGSNIYNYFIPDTGKSDDRVRLTAFLKAFEKLNYKNNNEVQQFEKDWFDIETFLRAMAMEYLTAHYDSYWFLTSNFVLYDDPKESKNGKYKFYFIDQDWDGTFGLNADAYCLRYPDYIKHSYKDYVNKKWGEQDDSPKRFAIDTLLSNAQIKKRFEKILTDIVINIFNPVAISKRLDALVERHREEVKWNYDVINSRKLRKGNPPLRWSMTDFEKNIEGPTSNGAKYGIKQFVYLRAKAIKEEFGINVNLGNKKYNDINTSGRCGPEFGECPAGQCCSQHGYCGTSPDHCNNCQSEFGKCDKKNIKITTTVKKITTTVKKTTTTIKKTTTTKVNVKKTTTTKANVKKTTTTKANIKKTTTTKAQTKGNTNNQKISTDGTCGAASGRCPNGYCCSQYGFCGNMKEYCGVGCQKAYGICN